MIKTNRSLLSVDRISRTSRRLEESSRYRYWTSSKNGEKLGEKLAPWQVSVKLRVVEVWPIGRSIRDFKSLLSRHDCKREGNLLKYDDEKKLEEPLSRNKFRFPVVLPSFGTSGTDRSRLVGFSNFRFKVLAKRESVEKRNTRVSRIARSMTIEKWRKRMAVRYSNENGKRKRGGKVRV